MADARSAQTLRANGDLQIKNRRRLRVRALIFVATLTAIAIHNADRYEVLDPTPGSTTIAIEYGWPLTAARGSMDREHAWRSTGAPQFWSNTYDLRLDPIGISGNLLLAIVLSFSCANAFAWIQSRLHARLTIATILGTTAFAAIAITASIITDPDLIDEIPGVQLRLIIWYAFEYLERFVWFCVFVACIWIPNQFSATLKLLIARASRRRKNVT